MSAEDRLRWDERYRRRAPAVVPRPPTALVGSGMALPPAGRALDVACGTGSVSSWFAGQGWSVLGVDVSPVAIAVAEEQARVYGVAETTTFEILDLDVGLPAGTFDVVVCQRFRDPARYPELAAAVAPGGLLLITVLSSVGHTGEPGPFRAPPGELVAEFAGRIEVLWSAEADGEAHLVARR